MHERKRAPQSRSVVKHACAPRALEITGHAMKIVRSASFLAAMAVSLGIAGAGLALPAAGAIAVGRLKPNWLHAAGRRTSNRRCGDSPSLATPG